jgi:tRNA (guanine-N7-)-methyltransferase
MENEEKIAATDTGIRTFVLRAGRMTEAQRRSLETLGPRFCLDFLPGRPLDLAAAFGNDHPVVAEIGFGMGQATWQIARDDPERNFLGFEVHTPGVGKLLHEIGQHGIQNLRIMHHDAVEAFESVLGPETLSGLHIFYPDPWPKKRHQKRRLLRPGIIDILVSRLVPGGYLYFVTDIEEYALASLELLKATRGLANRFGDFAPRQTWRPETKFETRALRDGRGAYELVFDRVAY